MPSSTAHCHTLISACSRRFRPCASRATLCPIIVRGMSNQNGGPGVEHSGRFIDLRSDTVTLPSDKMRQAMANAVLGDDVYGEDPTVNELEARCAKLFGKEAAIFVASGTMGNFLAVTSHCQRGDEIIVGRQSHIHRWEQGNYAQFGSVSATVLQVNKDGTLDLDDIRDAVREKDSHMPVTKLICLENTHNFAGGKVLTLEYMKKVRVIADEHGLKIHIDGARFMNAVVALGVTPAELAAPADSLMLCFSKGLGAPVGSILVGTKDFIATARHRRKALGGGWRQGGVLAAACHIALDEAEITLKKDHVNAKKLAHEINARTPEGLRKSILANEEGVTNMVFITFAEPKNVDAFVNHLQTQGILACPIDSTRVRLVPNWNVSDEDVDKVLDAYSLFVSEIKH